MNIPEISDGASLPYYQLVQPSLPDCETKDGGEDLKSVFYTHTNGDVEVGTIRRRTHRTSSGEKAPIAEEYARESAAISLLLALGIREGSAIVDQAKKIAAGQWPECDLIIDDEVVHGQRWQQDGWSVVAYLTPTLIIYAVLPDELLSQPLHLARLA